MKKKECKGCNRELPLSSFGSNKASKDGKQYRCRECFKNYVNRNNKVKQSVHFDGSQKKPSYDRVKLLEQIEAIRRRECNKETASGFDFTFLWTNEKFY